MIDDEKLKTNAAIVPDELDLIVEDLAADLSPDNDVTGRVTPWKNAIYKVVIGLALTVVQLNFWNLNYILPLVAVVLLLTGSRALRTQNRGFNALFWASIFMAVLRGFLLISAGSCLWALLWTDTLETVLSIIGTILNLVLLIAFRTGRAQAREKAGTEPKTGWATAAILWYLAVIVLELTGLANTLIYILFAVYLVIIIALIIQARNLSKAGYTLEPEPSKLSDLTVAGLYVGIIVAGIAVCGLFFTRLPMQWQERDEAGRSTELARQAEQQLTELGMPQIILNDLGGEELALMWGADKVLIQELPENFTNDPSLSGLLITHVAVRTPSQNGSGKYKWWFIHYFLWPEETHFAGVETIKTDALYRITNGQGQTVDNAVYDIYGRVLMDKNGMAFEAPYYGHSSGHFSSDDPRSYKTGWVMEFRLDRTRFSAKFSFPRKTQNARGYIMYSTIAYTDDLTFCSEIVYWHHKGFYYPFADPTIQHNSIIPGRAYMNRSEQTRFSTAD